MNMTARDKALKIAGQNHIVTAFEWKQAGIHNEVLRRLVHEGRLEQIARGQYRHPAAPLTEHHSLGIAARAVPRGVVCLLSALSFHGVGTQLPADVWMAIDRRAGQPRLEYPPLKIVRFSGEALREGIEIHRLEGYDAQVYSVAKTIADCFKYRNKIGLDIALEALKDAWQNERFDMADLDRFAGICRVQRVMQPYLEMLVA